MNLILNLVSGGNGKSVAQDMCHDVVKVFVDDYIAAPADQKTAIYEANYPKVKEVCTVAAYAHEYFSFTDL